MPCDAWLYNSRLEIARLFRMRILFAGVLPMIGWETYLRGPGRMHGKLLGLVTVADGTGPEFDLSELVTWLNDAVLLVPSMLLGPTTTWRATGDDESFDVSLTDAGRTVSARVLLDREGTPRDFSTTDRFADLPGGLVQARWTTPVDGWRTVEGRRVPTRAGAVWHLPDGPFRYAELTLGSGAVTANVPPGA